MSAYVAVVTDFISATDTKILAAAATVVVGALTFILRSGNSGGRKVMKPKDNSDNVILFTFSRWARGASPSTGCLKAETFLRLAKIPYTIDFTAADGPTGRWPYITHKGQYICDSNTIAEYIDKEFKLGFDAHLSSSDVALGTLLTRTLEKATYFGIIRSRWVDNFQALKANFPFPVPEPLKSIILNSIRKSIITSCNEQGNGDRTDEEYQQDLVEEVLAVKAFLPKKGKFFGNHAKPSSYDALLYAHLQNLKVSPFDAKKPLFFDVVNNDKDILAYIDFVEQAAFPDMKEVVAQKGKTASWKP